MYYNWQYYSVAILEEMIAHFSCDIHVRKEKILLFPFI